jgi:predicted AlkP superfamily phosphohydrolase/phosphomutase
VVRTVEAGIADPGGELPTGFVDGSPEAGALQRDRLYSRIAQALRAREKPRLFAIRYEGLDIVGHYYFDFAGPRPPRDVNEDEWRRHAQIVDRYYAYVDAELGTALEAIVPGDLLVVVSGFGMDRIGAPKRLLGRVIRDPKFGGAHERAPDGFMIAYGSSVQPGRPPRGSIVDVTPTLLYFFGLPVARDMDGYARSDLFTRDFSIERPVTFIPTYRVSERSP